MLRFGSKGFPGSRGFPAGATVRFAVAVAVWLAFYATATAATWNVPHDRPTIQTAIESASDGDVIQVAPGAHEGPVDFSGKRILVASTHGPSVTRITTESGSLVVARSGETRESELSGFALSGGNGTRIAHATYGGAILLDGASPTLSDCVIRGNRADFGGAIACLNGAAPRLDRCVVAANHATREGGGLYAEPAAGNARLEIDDCDLVGNAAELGGGATFVNAPGGGSEGRSGAVHLGRTRFRWNRATRGGGAWSSGTSLTMQDVRFEHNDATRSGAGIEITAGAFAIERAHFAGNRGGGNGAAISLVNTTGIVSDSRFEHHAIGLPTTRGLPPQGGGAIAIVRCRDVRLVGGTFVGNAVEVAEGTAFGGALFCFESSSVTIEDVVLRNNRVTGEGGAIGLRESDVELRRVRADENHASVSGGAIGATGSDVRIESCAFSGNSADNEGGAIATSRSRLSTSSSVLLGNLADVAGAGAAMDETESSWTHVTITRNAVGDHGPGLYLVGGAATLVNSIVRGNTMESPLGGDVYAIDAHLDVRSCILDRASVGLGESNLDVDPGFVSPAHGDIHLRLDSPCVDAGLPLEDGAPSTDAEGDARIVDGDRDGVARADIGADELRPEIAARFGGVAATTLDLAAPLRVNGSRGDRERIVRVPTGEPIRIEMLGLATGPLPARFALYTFFESPDETTVRVMPFGLGLASFALPLSGGDPGNPPIAIWNNAGHRPSLGTPTRTSVPAPSRVACARRGVDLPGRVTLQGIVEDSASSATVRASLTNAVVIEIYNLETDR